MSALTSQAHWQTIKTRIRALCIESARHRETITYSDVIRALGPDSGLSPRSPIFHRLLGEMCHEEEKAGRGLLCALVVAKMTGIPGQAFFPTLFAARGCDDPQICWEQERDRLFDYWESHPDE